MNDKKRIISPISCEKEPMSTIFENIQKYARLKDIPVPLAVRKFLIAGNGVMRRFLARPGGKDESKS